MEENLSKWEGKVSTRLTKANADQIWPLFKDEFFSIDKWFPNMTTCYGVEGVGGEVGCVRYCAGFLFKNGDDQEIWSKERLIAVDTNERCMSYEIVDCSFGFKSYLSTVKVVPGGGGDEGCVIEWSFAVDPVEGLNYEDMVRTYQDLLTHMAKKMEDVHV